MARPAGRTRVPGSQRRYAVLIDPNTARDPGNIQRDEMQDMISIEVTNLGNRPVRINSIGWHWLLLRKLGALQNPPEPQFRSHGMPATLNYGEQLQWALTDIDVLSNIAEHMLSRTRSWPIKLHLLRIIASTATGHRFRGKLGPSLKKECASTANSAARSGTATISHAITLAESARVAGSAPALCL
jgi:hypothetical protein